MVPSSTTSVTIPNSVTTIGDSAFEATPLTNVTISNGVTNIGDDAFLNTQLTNVTIPNSLAIIHDNVFDIDVIITRGEPSNPNHMERFIRQLPNLTDKTTVEIDRNNLLDSILHKNDLFNNDVFIKFKGEDGIDCGGLKREFFTLLGNEIIKKYFFEDEGNYCIIKNEDARGEATIPINIQKE